MEEKVRRNSIYKWSIRIAGTAIFSWLVLRNGDPNAIIEQIAKIDLLNYILLFVVFLFQHYLISLRWKILLGAVNLFPPIRDLYRIILYGQGLNKILPSSIGGDSAKFAYIMYNHPEDKVAAVGATILDRVIGLYVLCFIILFTLPFIDYISISQKVGGLLVFGSINILVIIIYMRLLDTTIEWILNRKLFKNLVGKYLDKFWYVFQQSREHPAVMIKSILFSIVIKIIMILSQYYTFRAIGVIVPVLDMFFSVPLVNLITTIPISIGGLGVREASLTTLLNISADEVVSYSLIRYSMSIVIIILMLFVSLITNDRNKDRNKVIR